MSSIHVEHRAEHALVTWPETLTLTSSAELVDAVDTALECYFYREVTIRIVVRLPRRRRRRIPPPLRGDAALAGNTYDGPRAAPVQMVYPRAGGPRGCGCAPTRLRARGVPPR